MRIYVLLLILAFQKQWGQEFPCVHVPLTRASLFPSWIVEVHLLCGLPLPVSVGFWCMCLPPSPLCLTGRQTPGTEASTCPEQSVGVRSPSAPEAHVAGSWWDRTSRLRQISLFWSLESQGWLCHYVCAFPQLVLQEWWVMGGICISVYDVYVTDSKGVTKFPAWALGGFKKVILICFAPHAPIPRVRCHGVLLVSPHRQALGSFPCWGLLV